jgi:hypothetical protein
MTSPVTYQNWSQISETFPLRHETKGHVPYQNLSVDLLDLGSSRTECGLHTR